MHSMPALFWLATFVSLRKETWPRRVWASRDSDPEYGRKSFPLRQHAGVLRNNSSPLLLDLFIFMYESFACMYICVSCACLVPMEVRIGCHIPWNWNCGWLCGCWELKLRPLQEQHVFLTSETSSTPQLTILRQGLLPMCLRSSGKSGKNVHSASRKPEIQTVFPKRGRCLEGSGFV